MPGVRLLHRVHRQRADRVDRTARRARACRRSSSSDSLARGLRAQYPASPATPGRRAAPAPITPGVGAALGERDPSRRCQQRGQGAGVRLLHGAVEEQVAALRTGRRRSRALGLEDVDVPARPTPSMRAEAARAERSASASPLARGGHDVACRVTCAPSRPRSRPRRLSGWSLANAVASRSSARPLQSASRQPRLGQLPGQSRAVRVASPRGPARRRGRCAPRKISAVDHDAAAHARAERVHHEVAHGPASRGGPRRARRSWRRCPRSTGSPKRSAQLLAERRRRAAGCSRSPPRCRWRSRSGDGTPIPTAVPARPRLSITSRDDAPRSRRDARRVEHRGALVASITEVPETAAAAIFVPPTSTPTLSSDTRSHSTWVRAGA